MTRYLIANNLALLRLLYETKYSYIELHTEENVDEIIIKSLCRVEVTF